MSKSITKEEFDEKYVGSNLVVNCKTFELSQEFRELADKFGYKWYTGTSYIDESEWLDYKDRTCYELYKGMYASVDSYKDDGYAVVEFDGLEECENKNEDIFKVIIKLVDEDREHHLIMHKDKMQKSLNVLTYQRYKDVFFEAIDGSVFYIKKDYIVYIKTEVL